MRHIYIYIYEYNCHVYHYRKLKYTLIEEQGEGHSVLTNIISAWGKQFWPQEQTQQSMAFLTLPAVASEEKTLSCHTTLCLISSQGYDHYLTLFFGGGYVMEKTR